MIKLTKLFGLGILLATSVSLSGCARLFDTSTSTPPQITPTGRAVTTTALVGTRWQLETFGAAGAEAPLLPGTNITLEFMADGRVAGSGGCNSYSGPYQTQNGTLAFGQITSTARACTDDRATQQEQQYFKALTSVGQHEMNSQRLKIWYEDGRGVLHFLAAPVVK